MARSRLSPSYDVRARADLYESVRAGRRDLRPARSCWAFRSANWLWLLVCVGSLLLAGCRPTSPSTSLESPESLETIGFGGAVEIPEPPLIFAWDFQTGKTLGWKPINDLRAFEADEEGLHIASTGGDPYMLGPVREIDAAKGYYVSVRMRSTLGSDAQLFWVTNQDTRFDEAKSQHFAPKPDGQWHTYMVPVHENPAWNGTIRQLRLDPTVQEGSEITIAWVKVVGMQPGYVTIADFATRMAVVEADEPFWIDVRLVNAGDTPTDSARLQLTLPEELSLVEGLMQLEVGSLEGGEEHTVSWTAEAPTGVYPLSITANGSVVGQTFAVVADLAWSAETLESGELSLVFLEQPYGYGIATLFAGQSPLGRLRALGSLTYRATDGSDHKVLLFADRIEYLTGEARLPFSFHDVDGAQWEGTTLIRAGADGAGYEVKTTLRVDREVQILNWTGLAFYAGDGAFGTAKESALFPGVEFLLDDEQSSGTDFFNPPGHERYVPHPLKVTIPLMAVTQEGTSVGLAWDPLQSWDGDHDRPGALFAAPNTWDGQENQAMALFVPGPTLTGEENRVLASTPYVLGPDDQLSLTARLFAVPAEDALAPLTYWLSTYELPPFPSLPRTYEEGIRLSLDSSLGPTWEAEQQGWHYALHDPWGPGASPVNELHLWLAALRGDLAPDETAEIRDLVRDLSERTDYAGGQPNPAFYIPALEMHLADADDLLNVARFGRERLVGQNPQGFWPYVPQARSGRAFGAAGDTSSGQIAANALYLLRFARITGDQELLDAGLLALDYMEAHHSRRPEGAQVWELPLHCPDLLAAAWAEQSYLEAYWLTGDRHYAERAQWWAVSGLPFVYLWATPERPIMAYATVPVFAATNYTYSWLGRPVMWNGLDYALGLWDLNEVLEGAGIAPALDWRQVAEGITRAAMQMQPEEGAFLGMYPDAWDVVGGGEAYTWWLHPSYILQNLYLMEGAEADVDTVILREQMPPIHVSTVADILKSEQVGGRLELELRYYKGETTAVLVGQVLEPPISVEVDGQVVPEIDALQSESMGWRYRDNTLVIKVPFANERAVVVIE